MNQGNKLNRITIKHSKAETIGPFKMFYTGDVDIVGKVNNTNMNYMHIFLFSQIAETVITL